ncbi:hypothetical protein [Geosporobacter ferrireducens]|uniref:hypothetical protein n=1 Tax=Geosporobacter ferrireducens TaxID=1424294 RepID=UPI0012EAB3E4|nr:hypothetical protein [Geosporobacter ferrireducens]
MTIEDKVVNQEINKAVLKKIIRDFISCAENLLDAEKITQIQYHELVDQKMEFLKMCK